MRIMGIDPGLATIGIGIIDAHSPSKLEPKEWMTITTDAGNTAPERLLEIERDLDSLLTQFRPELAVVEKLFFSTNVRTAMDVAQGRGVILATLARHNIPILEPTPLELKSAITGDGRADKKQLQQMIQLMLHLTDIPSPDDAADALALAVYGVLATRVLATGKK
jgi:crossover junction endodeoxyribonuclease RuvC